MPPQLQIWYHVEPDASDTKPSVRAARRRTFPGSIKNFPRRVMRPADWRPNRGRRTRMIDGTRRALCSGDAHNTLADRT